MRNRLRAVECPSDIIDQIGGWATKGERQGYGEGYSIEGVYEMDEFYFGLSPSLSNHPIYLSQR